MLSEREREREMWFVHPMLRGRFGFLLVLICFLSFRSQTGVDTHTLHCCRSGSARNNHHCSAHESVIHILHLCSSTLLSRRIRLGQCNITRPTAWLLISLIKINTHL